MSADDKEDIKRVTRRSSDIPEYSRQVLIESDEGALSCDLIDYSPFGLGVLADKGSFPKGLGAGSIVRIGLSHGEKPLSLRARLASATDFVHEGKLKLRIGFEIVPENQTIVGMRRGKRFFIDPGSGLKCIARDSTAPGEELYFTIRDFSGGGLMLETSARNKFIFPGAEIELELLVSESESVVETVVIRHVQAAESIYLVGCAFLAVRQSSLEKIIAFYLRHAPTAELNKRRDEVKVVFDDLKVKVNERPSEILQIIGLRSRTPKGRGAAGPAAEDPWLLWSDSDLKSHHLMVKYKSRVVATAKLLVVGKEPSSEGGIDERCVELCQIYVDRDFADTPAYLSLWAGIIGFLVESKAPFLIWRQKPSARYTELPRKLGIMLSFDRKSPNVLSLDDILSSKNANFIAWSCVVAPLLEKDVKYQKAAGEWRLVLAKIARKFFAKDFTNEKHLDYRSSIR